MQRALEAHSGSPLIGLASAGVPGGGAGAGGRPARFPLPPVLQGDPPGEHREPRLLPHPQAAVPGVLFPHRKFAKVLQLLACHLLLLFLGVQPKVLGDANLQLPAVDHPEDQVEAGQDAGVDRGEQGHPRQGDESDQVQPKWLVTMIQFSILRETVEQGAHFRKTVGLNLRTIPDPFGSYLSRLPCRRSP